jgi:hypothetical protein
VGADKPVEFFQLAGLADEHVLGDQVELLGGVYRAAVRLDDPGVDDVQAVVTIWDAKLYRELRSRLGAGS